ncbi:MAG: hypothetical protein MZW92_72100 [Comamonadaceae bacterium]|nr:hypothetical protein [Comamonadaceae bacterium]
MRYAVRHPDLGPALAAHARGAGRAGRRRARDLGGDAGRHRAGARAAPQRAAAARADDHPRRLHRRHRLPARADCWCAATGASSACSACRRARRRRHAGARLFGRRAERPARVGDGRRWRWPPGRPFDGRAARPRPGRARRELVFAVGAAAPDAVPARRGRGGGGAHRHHAPEGAAGRAGGRCCASAS